MRFSPKILLSLLAITPVAVLSAPAAPSGGVVENDPDYSSADTSASPSIANLSGEASVAAGGNDTAIPSSAIQPGAGGRPSGSCGRGRGGGGRHGSNRWGSGRPTGIPTSGFSSGAAPSAAETQSQSATEVVSSEAATSAADSPSSSEESSAQPTSSAANAPEPSVTGVDLGATGPGQNQGQGQGQGQGEAQGQGQGEGQDQGQGQGQPAPSSPAPSGGDGGGQASAPAPAPSSEPATGGGGGGGDTAQAGFEADILRLHNEYRAKFGAGPLVWDAGAAAMARDHYTNNGCQMAHAGFEGYGENLQGGTATLTAESAVNGWGPGEEPLWEQGDGFTKETGHFTQLVWKATTHLGCANVQCDNGKNLLACEYSPPGNDGGYATNVGK